LLGAGGQSETVAAHEASRQRMARMKDKPYLKNERDKKDNKMRKTKKRNKRQEKKNKRDIPIGQSVRVGAH
jgi:hypothetical protein